MQERVERHHGVCVTAALDQLPCLLQLPVRSLQLPGGVQERAQRTNKRIRGATKIGVGT